MSKVGERVIAICCTKDGIVEYFGEGVYEGDFVPEEAVGFSEALKEAGIPNPRIRLDDGKTVYGCECWWGSVEGARKKFVDAEWVEIDIEEYRKKNA